MNDEEPLDMDEDEAPLWLRLGCGAVLFIGSGALGVRLFEWLVK